MTFLTYLCPLNCQSYFPITLFSEYQSFQTFHSVTVIAMFLPTEYELIIFFFKKKKVAAQNAAGSLAKQNLTYAERWCDSQLFSLALAREARLWTEVKQLWYCRVVLDQCTSWVPHTNELVHDDNANAKKMLMCSTLLTLFISTAPRKKLIKHKGHLFVGTWKRSRVKITCILYHSKN